MDQKLQELTEKLYQEGVSKGNKQADELIAKAKQKSEELIASAEAKAKAIIAEAEQKAADLEKNTKSELQMASRQVISALEQEVANLVNGSIVSDSVKAATVDKTFMQQVIVSAVSNWAKTEELLVAIGPNETKELEAYFAANAKQLLNNGVKIESVNNIKTGFQIGPADGSFKVSFSSDDFADFFKEFIRPKLVELLFGKK